MTGQERTLLLFDIDEVLVNPVGYNVAMRRAVEHFSRRMGQGFSGPTDEEIAAFHAYGMTNEWLSGAMCLAALVVGAAAANAEAVRGTLDEMIAALRESGTVFPRPDYAAVAERVYRHNHESVVHTSAPVLGALSEESPPELRPVLEEILSNIRPPDAPFAVIFQQYALGPAHFMDVYGLGPTLDCETCLSLDQSALNAQMRERLRRMLETDHCGAVIYSARPSLPPEGLTEQELAEVERRIHPPEAEMAAEVAGLTDLPLIGAGSMAWLAKRRGRPIDAYVKPSPVQALAAIGAALSGETRAALEAAAALVEEGALIGPLAQLAAEPAHVVVFEDSSGGVRAVRQAADLLNRAGVSIRVTGVGIAQDRVKRDLLSGSADWVALDINEGLASTLDAIPPSRTQ